MPTTLTNGIQLPDKGSVDWYSSMQSNYNLIDTHLGDTDVHVTAEDKANWNSKQGSLSQAQLDAIAQVATNTNDIATLQSGKADASHTHSSSDITDIDDYATKDYVDNSISDLVDNAPDALDTLNELSAALNDDANFASTVTNALAGKADSSDLATVATSGSYTDLTDKPTINDSTITIQKNGSTVDTFTTNGSAKTINIPVPTKTSDLTNDSNFVDTSNSAVASGITSAKVTSYDSHLADTDIHVTTADKTKWNNNITQSYVFRYSSTALVASSTNSNTLLDNTDNLKVGDKVIDSSGVLFSVTTIDTQNSTFTIGTALIDLAQDSDVVHKSGNETVSGNKTFSETPYIYNSDSTGNAPNIVFKNSKYAVGDTTNAGEQRIIFTDKNNTWTGSISSNKNIAGTQYLAFTIYTTDNNNANISSTINYYLAKNGDRFFTPYEDSLINLGTTQRRWKSVCATNYYYGSNNVEFSTKFVTTDTNQTISGNKTFLDVPISLKSSTAELGVTGGYTDINFLDKNNKKLSGLTLGNYASSKLSYVRLNIFDKDTNNNEIQDTLEYAYVSNNNNAYLRVGRDNFCALGTTSYRWKGVYAQSYYYGSNNVEFSTKFVTTDTNQTISGNKTFSSNVNVYNSDSSTDTPNIILKNSKVERGSTTNIGEQNIFFLDKDNAQIGNIKCEVDSSGISTLNIVCTNSSNSSSGIRLRRTSTGTFLQPTYNNGCNLGTNGYRWYDVQTRAVNGVEPSSLSLPSGNVSDVIDISSYITDLNGGTNTYTAPANGWISIVVVGTAIAIVSSSWSDSRYRTGSGNVRMLYPVLKNETLNILVTGTTLAYARFIPCQGNV